MRLGGALSGTPLRVQALKRLRAEIMVVLATFPVTNRGPGLFQGFNVRTEIKTDSDSDSDSISDCDALESSRASQRLRLWHRC